MSHSRRWCLIIPLLAATACTNAAPPGSGDGGPQGGTVIRPSADYPRYWEYDGEPVMLLGGSRDDNLFQIDDIDEHLDLLARVGGNYIRNTMSSRDAGNVWPFHRGADGLYDLERLSDEYFDRFERLVSAAAERDIIVQIELWDRFDFAREPWLENPFRPANNVNYTEEESGLANEYPRHPGQNDNPFFRSIPAHDNHTVLLRYQHAQVDRMLEISLRYPNVLYTMDNETSATEDWGAYWARYVQQRAEEAGAEIYTTEMWNARDLTAEEQRRTLDHPELYAFADISQNNHNTGDLHWSNLQYVRQYVSSVPRPLNHVKIYGADTGPYGTDRDAIERYWRNLIGGAASIRFHRPPTGLGLNELAQANIRSGRLLLEELDIFRAEPDAESALLSERADDEAYLTRVDGEQYALYFPDGGSVRLNLTGAAGRFQLRWLDVLESRWADATAVDGGGSVALEAPGSGHWVALLTRE